MNSTEFTSILRRYSDLQSPERVDRSISRLQSLGLLESPGLIAALTDSNPNIRLLAVEILSELDPIEASLPAMINALKDPDRLVRIAAVDPVARFGGKACDAIPIFQKWLGDEKEYVRVAAAAAIAKIDPTKIPQVMPVLLDGLKGKHSLERANAAYAIGSLREAGSEALPLLEELLTDECAATRCEVAAAISKITGNPTIEVAVAVGLLGAEDWLDRYVGAEHLGALGPVAAPALSDLRRLLICDCPAVQTAVATAIERIEGL